MRKLISHLFRNERTSPKVATLASRIARMTDTQIAQFSVDYPEQIRSLAASALTQARDRAKG